MRPFSCFTLLDVTSCFVTPSVFQSNPRVSLNREAQSDLEVKIERSMSRQKVTIARDKQYAVTFILEGSRITKHDGAVKYHRR